MTSIHMNTSRSLQVLLLGVSSFAFSVPAIANDVIFTTSGAKVQAGQRTTQTAGLTQIKLKSGAVVSITQGAQYTLNEDSSIDLHKGSITVTGAARSTVDIRMPGGIAGRIVGTNSSGSFSVSDDGKSSGHTLTGVVRVSKDGKRRRLYREGQMWEADSGEAPKRSIANAPVQQPSADPTPSAVASISGDAGPVNAALNGIPLTLGDALAAAGASSDILGAGRRVEAAVANPSLGRFPSGDLALLVASAADLEQAYGARPFNAAQADIIRTYLGFLARGASGADFLAAYANFTLGYLELIRAGGVPSGFTSTVAGAADIDAYLGFISRTGAISSLSAQDRVLADAYLAFLASGQDRDLFAASFTELTAAYFAFLRNGGVPSEFTGASQEALAQSIVFLRESGLLVQLSASDQALVTAFLNNGGINFAGQFQVALSQYFAFLASGQRPSDYTVLDQATLRAYLETLSNTGLLATLLGDQAQFYTDYLAFLRAGGDVDAFAGLPVNVFARYQVDLTAYFEFLANGGLPSAYTPLSQEVISQYIAALEEAGATQVFLGELAEFYQAYFAFLSNGGNPDNFAGLPVPPDFPAFASALNAYAAFLAANGLPSEFTQTDIAQLRELFSALQSAGRVEELLGENATLLTAYFAFLNGGGAVDAFANLPIYQDYAAALNAYFDFLAAGNLPSAYTELDQATIEAYLAALASLQGGLAGFAQLNAFFVNYHDFLLAGNDPDLFDDLPGQTGGMGGDEPVKVALDGLNGWQFADVGLRIAISDAEVAQDGRIISMTLFNPNGITTDYSSRDDDLREFGRIGNDVAWTRYFVGAGSRQTNVSEHLFIGAPATNIPTSGTVQYALVGGTAPTNRNDDAGTQGFFTGELGLGFGSSVLVGFNFDLFTRGEGYRASTAGGAADPTNGGIFLGSDGRFDNNFVPITALTDTSCNGFCQAQVFGGVFGDGATSAGFTYNVFDQSANNAVQGIAIFASEGAAITGLGVVPDNSGDTNSGGAGGTGGIDQFDTTGLVLASFNLGAEGFTRTSRTNQTVLRDGGILDSIGPFSSGDTAGDQVTGDQYSIIGRWIDGEIFFPTGAGRADVTANAASHWAITTSPSTDFTLSGLIEYDLLGWTTPTYSDARTQPGTFDGTLAINWLSSTQQRLMLTAQVIMPDQTYSWSFDQQINNRLLNELSTNLDGDTTCAGSACQASFSFSFGGENLGERFAMQYNLGIEPGTQINGAALFGAPGTSAVNTSRQPASIAASADWSRWIGPAVGTAGAGGPAIMADNPIGTLPVSTPQPSARAAAIMHARQIMGGMVSWADPALR